MKDYDVIVVGAGDVGLGIVFKAVSDGLRVALIEKGKVGGTCVNVGCVPSKTLICSADRIRDIETSGRLGVTAEVRKIDFRAIMGRMKKAVRTGRTGIEGAIKDSRNLDFYHEEGYFTGDSVLKIGGKKIRGKKIFIASGARPFIPPIRGLDKIAPLTNESVLELRKLPKSLLIAGGGYVAVEYGHFFAALGTKVTLVEKGERIVSREEPEISDLLKKEMGRRMEVRTGSEVTEVFRSGRSCVAVVKDGRTGGEAELPVERVMVAAGRTSNADLVRVEEAGIETDERNFIRVDEYLETNRRNIWALGDAIGKQMFTHAGDREAEIAWYNATHRKKIRMDFAAVPHAVFTSPQVASVGLTEAQARRDYRVLVGRAKYSDTVKGTAMGEEEGFAKAVVEKGTKKILGFHIIGPEAAVLIQEVVNAVAQRSGVAAITGAMHIFPSLSEVITETLNNLE
ncbi:MAG: dihydrolipoyl dehydrogenase [Nitrospirae bacterium]|nr:dihydrolipoyl dehydrogenase [Nitrospirota bacterium]